MTGLWVALGIAAVLAALLALPVVCTGEYGGSLTLWLRYGPVKIRLCPPPEKKKKNRKKRPLGRAPAAPPKPPGRKEPEWKALLRRLYRREGLPGLFALLEDACAWAAAAGERLLRCLRLRELWIDVGTGGADAAEAALHYGQACAVLYPAVAFLVGRLPCRRYGVSVRPEFYRAGHVLACSWKVSARLGPLLACAIFALAKGLPLVRRLTGEPEAGNQQKQREISEQNEKAV